MDTKKLFQTFKSWRGSTLPHRNRTDMLVMGIVCMLILLVIVVITDCSVFYVTVLAPQTTISVDGNLKFPEKEIQTLIQTLDKRQEKLLLLLSTPTVPKEKTTR